MFSYEYCEIYKNTFCFWNTPMATSGKIGTKSLQLAKFQFQLIWTTLDINELPLHCDIIVVKRDIYRKIFVVVSIHFSIQTSKHLN